MANTSHHDGLALASFITHPYELGAFSDHEEWNMCRLIAYLGKEPMLLDEVISKPDNALIKQSKRAKLGEHRVNADGFGIGWYQHAISDHPAVFRSIQPAWNDSNLKELIKKVQSTCFFGQIRASTVGAVSTFNCHPFAYQQWLFAHNGDIGGFQNIKRRCQHLLDDEIFHSIKGHTDSEHFFALILQYLHENAPQDHASVSMDMLEQATLNAFSTILALHKKAEQKAPISLNIIISNGSAADTPIKNR